MTTSRVEGQERSDVVTVTENLMVDNNRDRVVDSVPFMDLRAQNDPLSPELLAAFERTLTHSGFCLGPEVERFEKAFAQFTGAKFAVGVNTGTSALHLALLALDVGPGDEVISTPHTFVATSWAISYVGARIRYVDVSDESQNIEWRSIEGAITPKTKAVIPVHLYGEPAPIEEIVKECSSRGVAVIEDCAQAVGARIHGTHVGNFGVWGAFSFYPGKNLGALGEGGALICNEERLYHRVKALRNHGSTQRYYHDEIGYNYRMEGLQGAVLAVKLPHLEEWTARRRSLAARYLDLLRGLPIRLPKGAPENGSVFHLFVIRTPLRDELKSYLAARGIETNLHYPLPLHLQRCYRSLGYREGDFRHAEGWARECLSLPLFPEMTESQQEYVVEMVGQFFRERGYDGRSD